MGLCYGQVGLDTVPISGDESPEAILRVMLDVRALALKYSKPLSCRYDFRPSVLRRDDPVTDSGGACASMGGWDRLFPVPGGKPGDVTTFESPHLSNTRIFKI